MLCGISGGRGVNIFSVTKSQRNKIESQPRPHRHAKRKCQKQKNSQGKRELKRASQRIRDGSPNAKFPNLAELPFNNLPHPMPNQKRKRKRLLQQNNHDNFQNELIKQIKQIKPTTDSN
jgi:hypothetical protein